MTADPYAPAAMPAFDAARSGYHMPGEFAPHAATWMAWPCRAEIWGDGFAAVKEDYARLARTIAQFEPLRLVVRPQDREEAERLCGGLVRLLELPLDDSWTRDSGPTFLIDDRGGLLATAWRFNAWGGKYRPYDQDALLARRVADAIAVPVATSNLVLEGGAILSDGEGTVITTESCLLHPNRNPGLGKPAIERELRRMLGAVKVIWLPGDPGETETDGHIDGLLAIAAPARVLIETCADGGDPRHEVLAENLRALELATDAKGRRFEWLPIEEAARAPNQGPRYCRSYVNFYCVNGAVIAPAYGAPADLRVADLLRTAYPDRQVVMLPIGAIAAGGGGFHCVTQQQPQPQTGWPIE